jgi:hypothetical protein
LDGAQGITTSTVVERLKSLKEADEDECDPTPSEERHGGYSLVPAWRRVESEPRQIDAPVVQIKRESGRLIVDEAVKEIELDEIPHIHAAFVARGHAGSTQGTVSVETMKVQALGIRASLFVHLPAEAIIKVLCRGLCLETE